jgi:hypothetical protein
MTITKSATLLAAVCAGAALAAAPATAGTCVRAAGSATAVTAELSTALAKEALYQSNQLAGRKGRGAVKTNCKYIGVLTTCRASQVACT